MVDVVCVVLWVVVMKLVLWFCVGCCEELVFWFIVVVVLFVFCVFCFVCLLNSGGCFLILIGEKSFWLILVGVFGFIEEIGCLF